MSCADPIFSMASIETAILERILARASGQSQPSARLSDREREAVDLAPTSWHHWMTIPIRRLARCSGRSLTSR